MADFCSGGEYGQGANYVFYTRMLTAYAVYAKAADYLPFIQGLGFATVKAFVLKEVKLTKLSPGEVKSQKQEIAVLQAQRAQVEELRARLEASAQEVARTQAWAVGRVGWTSVEICLNL